MGYENDMEEKPSQSRACRGMEVLLRMLAMVLSIGGAVVMAKDKQRTVIPLGNVPVTLYARHSYVEAFVFLVYANGIVAIYCFLSVVLSFFRKGRGFSGLLFLMDQALAYLLLAAVTASTEVSYIAKKGEDKLVWAEVCSNFHRFCNLVGVSLVLTFLSVLVLIILAILSSKRLFAHCPLHAPTSGPHPLQGV